MKNPDRSVQKFRSELNATAPRSALLLLLLLLLLLRLLRLRLRQLRRGGGGVGRRAPSALLG